MYKDREFILLIFLIDYNFINNIIIICILLEIQAMSLGGE